MQISDSQFLLDLRGRILANKEAGRPAKTGISDEEQIRFLALLRPARSAAVEAKGRGRSSSKAKTVQPMSDADVDDLFS